MGARVRRLIIDKVIPFVWGSLVATLILFIIFYLLIFQPFRPEPAFCRLCDYTPVDAICMVDTYEGQVRELKVYPPDSINGNGIDPRPEDGYGYMQMTSGAYWSAFSFPDEGFLDLTINRNVKHSFDCISNKKFFCIDCREKLETLQTSNSLCFADLHDLENIQVFSITPSATYKIRHYLIEVADSLNEVGKYDVKITSDYFDGGATLE